LGADSAGPGIHPSDLARGKVEKFSLDMLVTFAAKLGKPAKIELGQGS